MWVCERVSESVSARMRAYGRECARIRVFFPSDYINNAFLCFKCMDICGLRGQLTNIK